jgi:dienelactone hydrolase
LFIAGAVAIAMLGAVLYYQRSQDQIQQDYEARLMEIDKLIARDRFAEAYLLIRDLDPSVDPRRSEYAERIVVPGTLAVADEGVAVSFRPYGRDDIDWMPIGSTPFSEATPLPRGVLQFKLELEGHETREIVAKNPGPMLGNILYFERMGRGLFRQIPVRLAPVGEIPDDWVEVPASNQPFFLSGWSRDVVGLDIVHETPRFLVSKYEVSNAEYREFVQAGGYGNSDYWEDLDFIEDDERLTFDEAMARFVDRTGRPGPSTWELSSFADGEASLPVSGVSWYEAAAYARFRNASLPTIYHWSRFAHGPIEGLYPIAPNVEEESNFSQVSAVDVREPLGLGPWGTFNTAGNVREWVWNEAGEIGLIQGSQWQSYGNYSAAITAPRMNRAETNGIRLIKSYPDEPFSVALSEPIDVLYDDPFVAREPVSDDAFEVMRLQFDVPKRAVVDVLIEQLEETDLWQVEEHIVRFSQGEPLVLYVFKPKGGRAPFQTVLYGPPGNSVRPGLQNRDAIQGQISNFNYILKGGRAVVLPIWARTYERWSPSSQDPAAQNDRQRAIAILWHRDVVEALNYMENLQELSSEKVAYMGYSFGAGWIGQIVSALEPRIATSIFVSGGLVHSREQNPFIDGINFVPRITQPVLQLNGQYDHLFPYEESAVRHFNLLGTPSEQKKLVTYDAGHIGFPENQMVAEIADWLDTYQGPAR